MATLLDVLCNPLLTFIEAASELVTDSSFGVRADGDQHSTVAGDRDIHIRNLNIVMDPRTGAERFRLFNFDLKDKAVHLDRVHRDVILEFRDVLVWTEIPDEALTQTAAVSVPVNVRSTCLKQVIVLGHRQDFPLFSSQVIDMLAKDTLYLVVSAVNPREVNAREVESEFIEEGFHLVIHVVVLFGLHYKYNTIFLYRKIYFTFLHEQKRSLKPGSMARIGRL